MTASTDRLVCGCIQGVAHWPACTLGAAEQVAIATATARNLTSLTPEWARRPRLLLALDALFEAGLLHDPAPGDLVEDLQCLLDTLWEMGLIGHSTTVDGR
jgi:hypothetical protein